jgi:uncharacterized protein YndB with AHSA1/START domain
MPSAQRSVVIHRPREEVFDFFTDPSNESRWRSHVKEVSADGPIGVGSRIHQVVTGPGGRGISADIEVTAHEPPDHYAFKVVTGPVRPTGEFRFAGDGEATKVSFSLDAQLSGVKKLLMSGAVQKSMDGEMQALDRAKALLESA